MLTSKPTSLRERLKLQENSPEDILAVTREMNTRLDGGLLCIEQDDALQHRFEELLQPPHHLYGCPARVGTDYLNAYRHLLD